MTMPMCDLPRTANEALWTYSCIRLKGTHPHASGQALSYLRLSYRTYLSWGDCDWMYPTDNLIDSDGWF